MALPKVKQHMQLDHAAEAKLACLMKWEEISQTEILTSLIDKEFAIKAFEYGHATLTDAIFDNPPRWRERQ